MATVNENIGKLRYEFLNKFEKESNKGMYFYLIILTID